ncbi:MAG: cupredoxin domain-containing protein [Dehalococcoidia bacterium]|nr:cupredoxin domain-containing protein [Dehalococcoidia bacterium]
MIRLFALASALALVSLTLAGCEGSDDGGDRRVIAITQTDEACTPASIDLALKEEVTFEVKNDSDKAKEVEGIDGTKLEETIIPEKRTRNVKYTAPGEAGTYKIKCYQPGGMNTIIELKVS